MRGSTTAAPIAILPLAVLALVPLQASAAGEMPTIGDTTRVVESAEGGVRIDARRLTLPGTVNAVAYGATRKVLVVSYSEKLVEAPSGRLETPRFVSDSRCIAYDLTRHRVLWQLEKDLLPLAVLSNRLSNRLVALRGKSIVLLELDTGEELRRFAEDALLVAQGSMLVVRRGDSVERLALETGEPIWRSPLAVTSGSISALRRDSVLYVAGEGVAAVDLSDGAAWEYRMDRVRSDVASSVVTNVVAIGVSLLALSPVIPSYWGARIEMSSKLPLLRGDRLYAVADTEVVCLMRSTGEGRWRRRLGRDEGARIGALLGVGGANRQWPGQTIVRDAGDAIAVLSLGFAQGRTHPWKTDPPTLALLDPGTGATRRRIRVGRETLVRDYHRAGSRHLVLAPERVLVLDETLAIRDTIAPPTGHRELIGFLPMDSAVVVRTNAGLFELDPDSLTQRWERNLGGGVDVDLPRHPGARIWFVGRRALLGHSMAGNRPQAWIPFDAAAAAISDGAAILLDGRTVEIMPLPAGDH